ncbi:MAG: hypothetical protein Q7V88_13445 [Actinomycetota bacterium]|nr:hypothetical protein [Actinomycetota bacterium]
MSDDLEAARVAVEAALQRRATAHSAAGRVSHLNAQLVKHRREANHLRVQLVVETADAEHWRGLGFSQMLLWLVGRLAERRADEADEALAIAVRLADCEALVEQSERELAAARAEQEPTRDVEQAVAAAEDRFFAVMRTAQPELFQNWVAAQEQLATRRGQMKETTEAISAVDAALARAAAADDRLASAHRWGTFDVVAGGLITSMVKHERVDEAIGYVHQLNAAIMRVETELSQVSASLTVPRGLEAGSWARTWDVWFDNLFSDLSMQARIEQLHTNVTGMHALLEGVRRELVVHLEQSTRQAVRLEARVNELLVG